MSGIDYRYYQLSKKEKRDCIIIAYVSLFVTAYIFYHSIAIAVLAGVAIPFVLKYYSKHLANRRKEKLMTQFKDLLYSLSASFAAGRHMREGLSEAYDSLRLMYDDNASMVQELANMLIQIKENRADEEMVLRGFAKRSDSPDLQSFIDVYFICRATGADLQKVILQASDMLMDKISIEKEIRTLTAQKRFEGKLISLMPVVIILFLNLVSPDYMEGLYTTLLGRIVMTAALMGIVYSYFLTSKLTEIEV